MFNYKWFLKDGFPDKDVQKNGLKVFSTFACGGGSTMGYKLAGYDVIGANDIDKDMERVYRENFNPKIYIKAPIKDLLTIDLPEELYNLDILDGSPPCSTFSMAGQREKNWGKEKKFREGQSKQVLDDLFFDFIDLAERLKPKVIVAENVKGMLAGNAKGYLVEIHKRFEDIGYNVQLFCLNAASMGVPQKRERIFFICSRKVLGFPKIELNFNEKQILFKNVSEGKIINFEKIENSRAELYDICDEGKPISTVHKKGSFFNSIVVGRNKVCNTIASGSYLYHPEQKRKLSKTELELIGTFPLDYNFLNIKPIYLIGMSVPPVMMAQIANQIYLQLFKK